MPGHSVKMTPYRRSKCVRDKAGRFLRWLPGDGKKAKHIKNYSPKWQNNNAHGIRVHIGMEFSRQHGRRARVGDVVRKKRKGGKYHKQAAWYVRTRYGWRDSGSTRRPTAAEVRGICQRARPSKRRGS